MRLYFSLVYFLAILSFFSFFFLSCLSSFPRLFPCCILCYVHLSFLLRSESLYFLLPALLFFSSFLFSISSSFLYFFLPLLIFLSVFVFHMFLSAFPCHYPFLKVSHILGRFSSILFNLLFPFCFVLPHTVFSSDPSLSLFLQPFLFLFFLHHFLSCPFAGPLSSLLFILTRSGFFFSPFISFPSCFAFLPFLTLLCFSFQYYGFV